MLNKKLIVALIFLIGLIAVSSASAADANDTDLSSEIDAGDVVGVDNDFKVLSVGNATYNDLNSGSDSDEPIGTGNVDESGGDGAVIDIDGAGTTVPDDNYNSLSQTSNTTVNKTNSTLTVDDIVFDYNLTGFSVATFDGASGIVAEVVNQSNAVVNVTVRLIAVSGLDAGNYTLRVTTIADDSHNNVTRYAKITVNKVDSFLDVDNAEYVYGGSVDVNAAFKGASGIIAEIDGGNVNVTGGLIQISGLGVGSYPLTITTMADANHNPVSRTVNVTVLKADCELAIGNFTLDYGSSAVLNVTSIGDLGIIAEIDGKDIAVNGYSVPISGLDVAVNGYSISISDLDVGMHHLTVTTIADTNHTSVSKTVNVTVRKANSTFSLDDVTLNYGGSANITVSPRGATGITAKIDGEDISVDNFTISISGLGVGTHTLAVTTIPDANHYAMTKTATITVKKIVSSLGLEDVILNYGDTFNMMVKTNESASIVAKIDGKEVAVSGNTISIPVLDAGNHTLIVTTISDPNHYSVTETATITVNKIDSLLGVGNIELYYGGSSDSVVSFVGASGFTAKIDGVDVDVVGSTIPVAGLDVGTHTLTVTTIPDKNHNAVTKNATIKVNKLKTSIAAPDLNATANKNLNLTAKVAAPKDFAVNEGTATFFDGETNIGRVSVVNGTAALMYATAQVGHHIISIVYSGSGIFESSNSTFALSVAEQSNTTDSNSTSGNATGNETVIVKLDPNLTVSVDDVYVGEDVVFNVSIDEKASGRITLTINGIESGIGISEGKGSFTIIDLTVGNYSALVKFEGDEHYLACSKNVLFAVLASQTSVNETNTTVNNSTSGNATGNGTAGNVTNATGNNSASGNATGSGTGNVTNITKLSPNITVSVSDVYVGEKIDVNVFIDESVTGKVTLTINNVESVVNITNGKGSFTIFDLTVGNYSALIKFEGDEYYLAGNKTVSFRVIASQSPVNGTNTTVNNSTSGNATGNGTNITGGNDTGNVTNITKANPNMTVSVSDVFVGGTVVVNVSIDKNTTGRVTFTFNGIESIVDISEGKGSFTLLNLDIGDYSVLVKFLGDEQFIAVNETALFNVKEAESPVNGTNTTDNNSTGNNDTGNDTNITKLDPGLTIRIADITVGETAVGYVEINPNATGKLIVNGKQADIGDGKITFTISNLTAGEYGVNVLFEGDENFNADNKTVTFMVNRLGPIDENPFNMDENKTSQSNAPTYSISLPGDATGNLTVTIAGKNYSEEVVNGTATVTVTGLPAGDYDVVITYSGDDKYAPMVRNATSKVVVDPKVVMNQAAVLYTAKYYVTVYGNDGKVAKGADVEFYVNGKKIKTVKTNNNGVASFSLPSNYLPNKKYTIKATALGTSSSKMVSVKQILSIKTVTVKKSAKKLVLTAILKKVDGNYLKGKKITFKFKGKKYTAKTNYKGVAKVTIKKAVLSKLNVGKKVTYQATYLKTTVKKSVKVKM